MKNDRASVWISRAFVAAAVLFLPTTDTKAQNLTARLSKPTTAISSPRNARDFYIRAGQALNLRDAGSDFPLFTDQKLNAKYGSAWKRREVFLGHNKRALTLLRQGFALPYSPLRPQSQEDEIKAFDFYAPTRNLARLLVVEADSFAHCGEYLKALNSSLDALRLSNDVSQGAMIDYLVGRAVSDLGETRLKASWMRQLDAAEARRVLQRLENLRAGRPSLSAILREEKRLGQLLLRELFKSPHWRQQFPTSKTPAQITVTFNRIIDEAIINANLPLSQRKIPIMSADDPVNETLSSVYSSPAVAGGFQEAQDITSIHIALTTLALHIYRAEHGTWPQSLSQLVPTILRRMPLDLFSNQPLRYIFRNDQYSLYSVGPDKIDDGGKPFETQKYPHFISPETKGDIVADVNTP